MEQLLQNPTIVIFLVLTLIGVGVGVGKWYANATSDDSDGGKKITKKEIDELSLSIRKDAVKLAKELFILDKTDDTHKREAVIKKFEAGIKNSNTLLDEEKELILENSGILVDKAINTIKEVEDKKKETPKS